jgi:hypothetical protein
MFFFAGNDLDVVFTLTSGGQIITPDPYSVVVSIYLDKTLQAMGKPVLSGQVYHFSFSVSDADIRPRLYNVYTFVVETFVAGASLIANGSFLVHVSDYDSLDSTEIYLSNENSEIYLSPASQSYAKCIAPQPAKPRIISMETFKQTGYGCDCLSKS